MRSRRFAKISAVVFAVGLLGPIALVSQYAGSALAAARTATASASGSGTVTKSVIISASKPNWTNTGIKVQAGTTITMTASGDGTCHVGGASDCPIGNPNGTLLCKNSINGYLPPGPAGANIPYNSVDGKIGVSGAPFLIGSSKSVKATTSRVLYLIFDDCNGHLGYTDNSGSYTVRINLRATPQPTKIIWPPLPDALVPLETVSNGCGGGAAGTKPLAGDTSDYVNSEIPFADYSAWSKAFKYHVNFREACKQHDAAYSHAKVNEMPLNGGKIIDYFTWTKKRIDDKFLVDMIKICDDSIPNTAKIALNDCKNNGGFHGVMGAKTRYNIVAATTYSQKIWKGLGFYQEAPALTGTWTVPGITTGPWSVYQSTRIVNIRWTGGSTQPKVSGEFRGTIISHDKDSTIQGFYVTTQDGVSTTPRAMTFSWNPATPNSLTSSNGFSLERAS